MSRWRYRENTLIPALLVATLAVHALADEIVLTSGRTIVSSQVWEEGDLVKCRKGGIELSFPRDQVKEIRRDAPPPASPVGSAGSDPVSEPVRAGSDGAGASGEPVRLSAAVYPLNSPERQLWDAAAKGDLAEVERLLAAGADPNGVTHTPAGPVKILTIYKHGGSRVTGGGGPVSPLASAAGAGRYDVAKRLLEAGADVNIRLPKEWDLDPEGPFLFLNEGKLQRIRVRTWEENQNPLRAAVRSSHGSDSPLVDLLLARNPAAHVIDGAVMAAISEENAAILAKLARSGMSPEGTAAALERVREKPKLRPLLEAAGARTPKVDALDALESGDLALVSRLLPELDEKGVTEIFRRAVVKGCVEIVRQAMPRVRNDNAVYMAVSEAVKQGAQPWAGEMPTVLLERPLPVDRLTKLFMAAVEGGNPDIAGMFLLRGVDINAWDDRAVSSGGSALMIAAGQGDIPMIRFLLDRGADVNRRKSDRDTPLSRAEKNGHDEAAALLRQYGAR